VFPDRRPASSTTVLEAPRDAPPQLLPLYTVDDALVPLYEEIADCPRCRLARTRSRTVPGSGPVRAELMLIGEGPGQREDALGLPFVGRAGQFLDELLASIGLSRREVYVCNVVKCRPPENRDPLPDELAACGDFLQRQIELVNPKVIATLGRFSMARWFGESRISQIHGRPATFDGRIVVPMYHPAAALRAGQLREVMKQDFAKIPALLAEDAPPPAPFDAARRAPGGGARPAPPSSALVEPHSGTPSPAAPRVPPASGEPAPGASPDSRDAPEWRDPPQERLL